MTVFVFQTNIMIMEWTMTANLVPILALHALIPLPVQVLALET